MFAPTRSSAYALALVALLLRAAVQAAQRGFLPTGDESYLAAYREAAARQAQQVKRLTELTDTPRPEETPRCPGGPLRPHTR